MATQLIFNLSIKSLDCSLKMKPLNPVVMFTNEFTEPIKRMELLIDSEYDMIRIPVIPMKGAKNLYCYDNVEQKIKNAGGNIQQGWQIVQNPFYVSAIHHAVWENREGHLVDVTPGQPKFDTTAFIPDDRLIYDGRIIDNVMLNISGDGAVDDFIAVESFKNVILAQSPTIGYGKTEASSPLWFKYKKLYQQIGEFLFAGNTSSSPCYCQSGLSYKLCHSTKISEDLKKDRTTIPDNVIRLHANY